MSNIIRNSSKYVSKQSTYTLGLIVALGVTAILFYFGNPAFNKSFKYLNSNGIHSKSFNLALNTTADPTLPTLCIITRIYSAQISYFPVLAIGLYHSGLHNIRIYVTNTDNRTDIRQLEQTIKFINELVLRQDFVTLLDLGEPPIAKDYGYGMTDRALNYVYKQHVKSSSICQYVTFTNGDNFYSRNFGRKILPHMKAGKDIIGWGFVSHHFKPHYKISIDGKKQTVPQVVDDGTEKCTPVELRPGFADLGAAAYRVSFLQKHNLYFKRSGGGYSFGSDGYFVEQAARRTSASIILKQTLLVHQ
jgi:hypothetical protein